jgi:hypothetical protein
MARTHAYYLKTKVYDTWEQKGKRVKYPTPRAMFCYPSDAVKFVKDAEFGDKMLIEKDGRRVVGVTSHGAAILERLS